jgi:hypothetical protein
MRRIATTLLLTLACSASVPHVAHATGVVEVEGASSDDGADSVTAVAGVAALNGSKRPPAGTSTCGPWQRLAVGDPAINQLGDTIEVSRVTTGGVTQHLYIRYCDSTTPDFVWVGPITPHDVATYARNEITRQLPTPEPAFAPPAESMFVNYQTWFGATPHDPITATATVPGITVTVTATPTKLTLHTGSIVPGDTTNVTCNPWGSTYYPADGCTWTPAHPSVEQATGTTDYRYHASMTITWTITWQSSTGTTGTLNNITTTTNTPIAVREIQTIGTG